jgi:hypothetical protein
MDSKDRNDPSVAPRRLLTQREAAAMLNVSRAYLRACDCPKIALPGNGPSGRPLIRYDEHEVWAWAERRRLGATTAQRRIA